MEDRYRRDQPRREYEVGYQPEYQARYQPECRARRAARGLIPGLIRGLITTECSLRGWSYIYHNLYMIFREKNMLKCTRLIYRAVGTNCSEVLAWSGRVPMILFFSFQHHTALSFTIYIDNIYMYLILKYHT